MPRGSTSRAYTGQTDPAERVELRGGPARQPREGAGRHVGAGHGLRQAGPRFRGAPRGAGLADRVLPAGGPGGPGDRPRRRLAAARHGGRGDLGLVRLAGVPRRRARCGPSWRRSDAAGPLSTQALESRVDLRRSRLEMMLKVLDVDGAVHRVRGGWIATGQPWDYDAERYARVAATRTAEQAAMLAYQRLSDGEPVDGVSRPGRAGGAAGGVGPDGAPGAGTATSCRMAFLRAALDDPDLVGDRAGGAGGATRAARSSPTSCRMPTPSPPRARRPGAGRRAGRAPAWPTGMSTLGVPLAGKVAAGDRAEPGRAVARLQGIGWGRCSAAVRARPRRRARRHRPARAAPRARAGGPRRLGAGGGRRRRRRLGLAPPVGGAPGRRRRPAPGRTGARRGVAADRRRPRQARRELRDPAGRGVAPPGARPAVGRARRAGGGVGAARRRHGRLRLDRRRRGPPAAPRGRRRRAPVRSRRRLTGALRRQDDEALVSA